jgi:uncharacterized protein (DUF1684 family)
MKHLKPLFFSILLFSTSLSCTHITSETYTKEIVDWREARVERLKSKTGWLNLAGLFWLKEGVNTFGSDSSNAIIFPQKADAFYGSFEKSGDSILLKASTVSQITINGQPVSQKFISVDTTGNPDLMESGSLAWYIIKRDGRYGIRLRDYNNPRLSKLDSIPCYKTDANWRIVADFVPFVKPQTIKTTTIIGGAEINNCEGELVFRKGLRKYKLLPFTEGNSLFIIFADKTNGLETYGNGRFMSVSLPDSSNKVILDFNKAYNPPCAFSPFATCPMPPRENFLDLEVEAGEKEVHLLH